MLPSHKVLLPLEPLPRLHQAAYDGDLPALNARLQAGDDPNATDAGGATALLWACECRNEDAARRLIEAGADVNRASDRGYTPLLIAVGRGYAPEVRLLLEAGASRDIVLPPDTQARKSPSPEHQAALEQMRLHHEQRMERLRKRLERSLGAEKAWAIVDRPRESHVPAGLWEASAAPPDAPRPVNLLSLAIRSGSADIVRALLDAGESPTRFSPPIAGQAYTQSPLHLSVLLGQTDVAQVLLEAGADPNDGSMLPGIVLLGRTALTRLLLEFGADPNRSDLEGQSAVSAALMRSDASMLDLLLDHGGKLPTEDTAEDLLNDSVVARHFLEQNPDLQAVVRRHQGTIWLADVEQGDRDRVRAALDRGADVNAVRDDGETALLLAVQKQDAETALLLVQAGADVNQAGPYGQTALYRASVNGDARMVALLLRAGADPERTAHGGQTPLFAACSRQHEQAANLLEKAGARVYPCDLVLRGETERLRRLWEQGTPVDAPNPQGVTALMGAAMRGNRTLARDLMERSADVNRRDKRGETALYYAVNQNGGELIADLLARGADVTPADDLGYTPLYYALMYRQVETAARLIKAGAPVGEEGRIVRDHLLHWVLRFDGFPSSQTTAEDRSAPSPRVRLLLDAGADPNVISRWGETPLTAALQNGATQATIALLLERGADINGSNDDDKASLDIAREAGPELTAFLEKRGARPGLPQFDPLQRIRQIVVSADRPDPAPRGNAEQNDTA